MDSFLVRALETANEILTAGILITSASLLLYSLTFNLRDRVARAFSLMLACVTVVFLGDLAAGTSLTPVGAETWIRFQWVGIAYIPVTYLHVADALLATTGQPSRGRRHATIRLLYLLSTVFVLVTTFNDWLVSGPAVVALAPHLKRGPGFWIFALYFTLTTVLAANFVWRAYQRCLTTTTRRRMGYLMIAGVAPALGTFPYLMLAGNLFQPHPLVFWSLSIFLNVLVGALLTVMAYTVAFFGVVRPDRVVKSRLFQWILRGPVVVSTVLMVTLLAGRYAALFGLQDSRVIPFFMVGTLLVLQFVITLVRIPLERLLFYGKDRDDVRALQTVEERLLTTGDLQQFLESALAAICDRMRVPSAFVAVMGPAGLELEVTVGPDDLLAEHADLPPLVIPDPPRHPADRAGLFRWGDFGVMALRAGEGEEVIGLLGLKARPESGLEFSAEEESVLRVLSGRVASALEDRRLQREVFGALDRLIPQIEQIQRLRAAARYSGAAALTSANGLPPEVDLAQVVKDALTHYWGGPKLADSPLMRLKIVERAMREHDGNAVNALRAILREAIGRLRPEGERRFTAEWILYNILDLKFLERRKVQQVTMRLAVSEADLYRKQRVAIEQVARAIAEMERAAARQEAGRG